MTSQYMVSKIKKAPALLGLCCEFVFFGGRRRHGVLGPHFVIFRAFNWQCSQGLALGGALKTIYGVRALTQCGRMHTKLLICHEVPPLSRPTCLSIY